MRARGPGPLSSEPRGALLDIRTLFRQFGMGILHQREGDVKTFGKIYKYPNGIYDIIASDRAVFSNGWEAAGAPKEPQKRIRKEEHSEEDLERARRRARACVRRLALANDFKWFVTLTLDPEKIDRYSPEIVVKRMSQWVSNQVKRRGLRYILVPELHKDGAIHFHGFFSDSLEALPSGHCDKGGHPIFNLPGWRYGFTTAIALYGDYEAAVAYVCKYIGKEAKKIGGRWYYSGGKLEEPVEIYVDVSSRELYETYSADAWVKETPGGVFVGVNGLKGDF